MRGLRRASALLVFAFLCCGRGAPGDGVAAAQEALRPDPRLDQARRDMAAGQFVRAGELYVAVLVLQPENVEALAGAADALQAAGRWPEAVPYLRRLVRIQPTNAARLAQFGELRGWQAGGREEALVALRRAVELKPGNPQAVTALAMQLMPVAADRAEAARLFERAIQMEPLDLKPLLAYAEMLSWTSAHRDRARELFERALELDPKNVRARVALAQLESWTGRTTSALDRYADALFDEPANVAALRGTAEILGWNGRFIESREMALRARAADANDPYAMLTLARADVGLGRYAEALELLAHLPPGSYDGVDEIRGDALRGNSAWLDLGFAWRDDRAGLALYRPAATVSARVGDQARVSVFFRPTAFRSRQGDFSSTQLGVAFDARPNDRLRLHVEGDGEAYGGAPTAADGAFDLQYRGRGPLSLAVGFRRAAVEDTLVSTKGTDVGGEFIGQVRSNMARASLGYSNLRRHYDASVAVSGGVYTGHGLDSNSRWGASGTLGATLSGSRPYVRVGYIVEYLSFGHDAGFPLSEAPPATAGGYFSPTQFLVNFATARVGYRLGGDRGEWFAEGSAGVQNVETTHQDFGDTQFAGTFATGVLWRPGSRNEFRVEYRFLDVFDAFRRNGAVASFRRYF
jgi:tetratricopeptide (TPR) repeat protein